MKFSPHRIKVFKNILVGFLGAMTLVLVVPMITNYYFEWFGPAPRKENLLGALLLIPLFSLLFAVVYALCAKDYPEAAWRALQKHISREGSAFPGARGDPVSVNQQGQYIVDDILTSPDTKCLGRHRSRFGNTIDYITTDGRGIVCSATNEKFLFFREGRPTNDHWSICISSPPDREELVAEIFFGDQQWAELNQEGTELELEFYPRTNGKLWKVTYQQAFLVLQEAKLTLVG